MTVQTENPDIESALQGLRDVLNADGYQLAWTLEGDDQLVVQVLAGPDACADCLVPAPVMEAILSDSLDSTRYSVARVELPATHE
jgi:hypothetical protein